MCHGGGGGDGFGVGSPQALGGTLPSFPEQGPNREADAFREGSTFGPGVAKDLLTPLACKQARERKRERERASYARFSHLLTRKILAGWLLSPGVLTDPHAREKKKKKRDALLSLWMQLAVYVPDFVLNIAISNILPDWR